MKKKPVGKKSPTPVKKKVKAVSKKPVAKKPATKEAAPKNTTKKPVAKKPATKKPSVRKKVVVDKKPTKHYKTVLATSIDLALINDAMKTA